MASVLDRDALSDSPLADLHIIAGELGLDGYRRLRKDDLVDAILERQGGAPASEENGEAAEEDDEGEGKPRRRGRRGGRGRKKAEEEGTTDEDAEQPVAEEPKSTAPESPAAEVESSVSGTIEVLGNGSGFVRVNPPEPDDGDVYVSAAQIRRCELVSGDTVSGPVRPPRRSERYPSLVRVETINDRPADEVADRARFEDLPAGFPTERLKLGSDDETLKAIEFLTPFGRGSRVVIAGAARAGKTEALRRLAAALAADEALEVTVALAGVRPEEVAEWEEGPATVSGSASFAASPDQQAQVVERAIEQGKRVATRGGHAVVLIDGLGGLPPTSARKALAAARNVPGQGSLTVVATSELPLGGETTVIALDVALASTASFPALDLAASGTVRAEKLVGDDGAAAIAKARADALAA